MRPHYGFDVRWSSEDEGYIATCPSFPGLSAFGETLEEALREGEEVIELYIEEFEEDGVPLPDAIQVRQYSGQLRLRLPLYLHGAVSRRAEEEKVSLNSFLISLIAAGVDSPAGRGYADEQLDKLTRVVQRLEDCADQQSFIHSETIGLMEEVSRVQSARSEAVTAALDEEYQDPVVRRSLGIPTRSVDY